MVTDEVRAKVRKLRNDNPYLPAGLALHWARHDPYAQYPGITWTDRDVAFPLRGTGIVEGYDVRVFVELDTDPIIDGIFTDDWRAGAVANPEWRPGDRNRVYRWYVSGVMDAADYRREMSRAGQDKHSAYTGAMRLLREEARRAIQPELYVIRVRVDHGGVNLAESTLHGFDVPDDPELARGQLVDAASGVIADAVLEAQDAADKLVAGLPNAGITLTRDQLQAWAGRELSDDDLARLDACIPNSSIPEAIATIVEAITADESGWPE